jgi:hypothetical protein
MRQSGLFPAEGHITEASGKESQSQISETSQKTGIWEKF